MTVHELSLDRRTLHGCFSRDLEPILTIDPGDSLRFATLDAGWRSELGEGKPFFVERRDELDAGHALIGPIEVRGARVGVERPVQRV